MKKLLKIIIVMIAVAAAGILAYIKFVALPLDKEGMVYKPNEDDLGDGYLTDSSDNDAPKDIKSNEITEFSCWFSTLDFVEPGELGNKIWSMTASVEKGIIKGKYEVMEDGWKTWSFEDPEGFDPDFMSELDVLVKKNDLAQFNGISRKISGIPEEYGARLDIKYASGENIYASDNEENYLPEDVMADLIKLFERCVQD